MLLLASETSARSPYVADVAREMSLGRATFRDAVNLDRQMRGNVRRIVLLTRNELSEGVVAVLHRAARRQRLGVIVAADPQAMRVRNQEALLRDLEDIDNVHFIAPKYSRRELREAVRTCRRGLLNISEDDLRKALTRDEFSLHYQPKVVRGNGEWRTAEAEALLRWQHPEHGRIGPLEFLPELEEFTLMGPVSEFVLQEAAAQLVKWEQQGLQLDSCINLASSQLRNHDLPQAYERIVRSHGLECSRFTFEIIEHDVADLAAPHMRIIKRLREKGFRVSLDNFDIAAASLGSVADMPVDEIKIHAAALRRASRGGVPQKLLAAVTGLAHSLGISVCAEGVEDHETYRFLDTIQCDKLQGYLISEAVMPELIKSGYSADTVEVHAVA